MTIDSGWVRVMKEEVPEAFRSTYPFKGAAPKIAYIDGMPSLMISEKSVRCWDDLVGNDFWLASSFPLAVPQQLCEARHALTLFLSHRSFPLAGPQQLCEARHALLQDGLQGRGAGL